MITQGKLEDKPARSGLFSFLFRPRYDAAIEGEQRRSAGRQHRPADSTLPPTDRRVVTENARDLQRNFAVAAWAIRRHMDYVSAFAFQGANEDPALNRRLEEWMSWYSRPENCDAARRHALPKLVRMIEGRRTVDGDVFLMKLRDGRVQPIESDVIRQPEHDNGEAEQEVGPNRKYIHGVLVESNTLRARGYAVHQRDQHGNYKYLRDIPHWNMWHVGYYERFDQVRGISPLTTAINPFRDCYEASIYALGKMKVSQLFGLIFKREAADDTLEYEYDANVGRYSVNFRDTSTYKLELDPGDDAEILESRQPSSEFQNFMNTMLGAALKSLDIPYSFFDEAHTNFFGSRAALMHYQKAVKCKQADLVDLLNRWTRWRLRIAVRDGELPRSLNVDNVRYQWVPDGIPWWRPLEEVKADELAIQSGFKTINDVTMERYNRSAADTFEMLSKERDLAEEFDLNLSVFNNPAPDMTAAPETNDDDDNDDA